MFNLAENSDRDSFHSSGVFSLDKSVRVKRVVMSDQNLMDDPLVSFDQPQASPNKGKSNDSYENRALDDIDPFGIHNGQDNHHEETNGNSSNQQFSLSNDLFPLDSNDQQKGKSSQRSPSSTSEPGDISSVANTEEFRL